MIPIKAWWIGPQLRLGPQLHLSRTTDGPLAPERYRSVDTRIHYNNKPRGGLWTSTYHPATGSAWVAWCRDESFGEPDAAHWWLLEPEPDALVLSIQTYSDLAVLLDHYAIRGEAAVIDWQALAAAGVAGVHLTEAGQWATRLTYPLSLYGWDCESTFWLRWAFRSVMPIAPIPATVAESAPDFEGNDHATRQ